jgi:uncharacterized protein YdeI (YjbR/CyaY-like superfamily)
LVTILEMDITETLYVTTREDWREWLEVNSQVMPEVWLVSYKKYIGRPSIPYNDAVEEALCFGWIDSIRKRLDDDRNVQRFSPRKQGSSYSQTNKERLARLIEAGKVIPSVLEVLGDVRPENYQIPEDILSALRLNQEAWEFFQATSPSYQRIRAAYIDGARKRPADFKKRLDHLIDRSANKKQFGYGIEDYY